MNDDYPATKKTICRGCELKNKTLHNSDVSGVKKNVSDIKVFGKSMRGRWMWLGHPSSPGAMIRVKRNWLQRLLYPKDFATITETVRATRRRKREPNRRAI
jgi:hypothetical protein